MTECCKGDSAAHVACCGCHHSLSDIQDFVTIVCYYNCKICDFSCTSAADIRSHLVESHWQRLSGTDAAVFHTEAKTIDDHVSSDRGIVTTSEVASPVASKEFPVSEAMQLISREFTAISQSGCEFLSSSTTASHPTDSVPLQSLQGIVAGQTLQLFVNSQEIQLTVPGCYGDGLQETAALPAGMYVENSSAAEPVDLVRSINPLVTQSRIGQTDQTTEMYVCDSCGTVFSSVGIVEHMLQVHGILLDSANEMGVAPMPPSMRGDQPIPPTCTRSMENTASIGTQAQLSKKPGRKRKLVVNVLEDMNEKRVSKTAEKNSAAAAEAVKTLGIERAMTADGQNGSSKRRILPPRALVEDYHIQRLRQTKPRTRSTVAAPKLCCNFPRCEALFRQQSDVDYHMKCHTEGSLFCCPECRDSFTDWSSMLPHLWTVHGIDLYAYQCGQCEFRADRSTAVTKHAVAEHGRKQPFFCSHCGQTFSKANLRNRHEKSHNNHRLFARSRASSEPIAFRRCVCDLCKRSFANKKSLNKHIEVNNCLCLAHWYACAA